MKNNLLRFLLVAVISVNALISFGQCEEKIRDFYVSYMKNMGNKGNANEALMKNHMSPELIAKIASYTAQYDADAVIHAQDVSAYGMESLYVIPLDGTDDGYMVKYKWSPESNETFIVVRATVDDGKLKILDIFPIGTEVDGKSYIKK